jgi:hypothetical protein
LAIFIQIKLTGALASSSKPSDKLIANNNLRRFDFSMKSQNALEATLGPFGKQKTRPDQPGFLFALRKFTC